MGSITDTARQILTVPKQDRRALIDAHSEPKALEAEIFRLWNKHKGFRVYLKGRTRSLPMIDPEGATLDEALKMAEWQFGRGKVERVITGEEERDTAR